MNLETEAPKLTKRNALERRVAGWPPLTSNLSVIQQHRSRKCPGRNPPRCRSRKRRAAESGSALEYEGPQDQEHAFPSS